MRLWLILPLLLVFTLAACSDDDDNDTNDDGATTTTETTDDADAGDGDEANDGDDADNGDDVTVAAGDADLPAACATPPATWTIRTDADKEVTFTDTLALSIQDGVAYTIYAADHEIDRENLGSLFFDPRETMPADGTLMILALTIFNADREFDPIAPGESIPADAPFGERVSNLIIQQGETLYNIQTDAAGQTDVVFVDDDTICIDTVYETAPEGVAGTGALSAPIVDSGL